MKSRKNQNYITSFLLSLLKNSKYVRRSYDFHLLAKRIFFKSFLQREKKKTEIRYRRHFILNCSINRNLSIIHLTCIVYLNTFALGHVPDEQNQSEQKKTLQTVRELQELPFLMSVQKMCIHLAFLPTFIKKIVFFHNVHRTFSRN